MQEERIRVGNNKSGIAEVLHEIKREHLKQREAGEWLQLSKRQIRRFGVTAADYQRRAECLHCLRGQPSNQKLSTPVRSSLLQPAYPES